MPPGSKLPDEQIEILRQWILAGAPMPLSTISDEEAERLAVLRKLEERPITPQERAWWAFSPVVRPEQPGNKDLHPVDAFLEVQHNQHGLVPSAIADKRTLIRRIYLDLVGLPPAPEEVEAFIADTSPGAWEALIGKLLDSQHYGE